MPRNPEYPFVYPDGRKFWALDRCQMTLGEPVIDRMAGDLVDLATIAGEDAPVMDADLVSLGWSQMHVSLWGAGARAEAHRRLQPIPVRELAIACALFTVLTGGIWLTGAASLVERLA